MTEPVSSITTPVRLEYNYTPGIAMSRFLRDMEQGRMTGRACSSCSNVFFPPRAVCSMCGAAFRDDPVSVAETGTVTTFCVVNVPFKNRTIDLPYACAEVLFDGADTTTWMLVLGVEAEEVRMGMRVRARWKPPDAWGPDFANLDHVEPTGEPDVALSELSEYL